jgi:hypothetical protein
MRTGLFFLIGGLAVIFCPWYVLPSSFHLEQHPQISNVYFFAFVISVLVSILGLIVVITTSTIRLAEWIERRNGKRE